MYLPDNTEDLLISLTALDGDPDLYVSKQPFPVCTSSTYHSESCTAYWSAQGIGNETIVIDHSDPCKDARNDCNPSEYVVGDFFIGVYGFRDSAFTIFASVANDPIQLADGVPQNVHTVLQSSFPSQTASQSAILGFCSESPISSESSSPMINIDSKEGSARLNVDIYVCSENSPAGACADTNTGKLSDMHPISSGQSSAAWIGSFTIESYESSGSLLLNRTKYETACSSSPCHFSAYVYAIGSATSTNFRVAFVKSGVRFVTLGVNDATAFPSAKSGDSLEAGTKRTYAMYVPQHEKLSVSLETCSGGSDAKLLLCGSSSCTDPFNPSTAHGALQGPKIEIASTMDSTYYATVSSSSEMSFQLKVGSGTSSNVYGPSSSLIGDVSVDVVSIAQVVVSWPSTHSSSYSSYEVYRIPKIQNGVTLNTVCGMHDYNPHNLEGPYVVSSTETSYTFTDSAFISNVNYEFVVFAVPLSSPVDGFKASFGMFSTQITGTDNSGSGGSSTETVGIIVGVVVVVLLVLAAIPVLALYRRTQALEERLQYEMQDVRNVAGVGGMSVPKDGSNGDGYGRVLIGGGDLFDEEALGDMDGFQPME